MTVAGAAVMTSSTALPGPPPDRFVGPIGNLIRFSRDVVGQTDLIFERYGNVASVVGGPLERRPALARWVLVRGADLFHEIVLQQDVFHKPPLNKQLSPKGENLSERQRALQRWGAGLFAVQGEAHKAHRAIMQPAFHKSRVDGYVSQMAAIVDEELQGWVPGTVRNIHDDMLFLTIRIVARCLLGENVTERGDGSIGDLIQRTLRLVISPSVFLLRVDAPGLPYHRFLDTVAQSDRAVRHAIEVRRARPGDGDLLSMLIAARDADGTALTEDHIIEHTGTIFIAGQETSSNALTFTLLLLAAHPQVAGDLLDELDATLHGDAPTADQLHALPFLDAVVRESMRVLPPVPLNARVVAHDTEFRGYRLPAGTQLLVSLYHSHRAPELFTRPSAFDPYRWQTCKPAPYEYAPFGTGPRTCLGAPFAMTELKVALAMILQRFRLELLPHTRLDRSATITMSVKDGLRMRVRAQDRRFGPPPTLQGNICEMVELRSPR